MDFWKRCSNLKVWWLLYSAPSKVCPGRGLVSLLSPALAGIPDCWRLAASARAGRCPEVLEAPVSLLDSILPARGDPGKVCAFSVPFPACFLPLRSLGL